MPPTIDNPTDPARDGSDEDWARWEQTFRDARPVLPEAAMARIEAAIRREAEPDAATPRPRSRLRRRIVLLVAALIAINAMVLGIIVYFHKPPPAPAPAPALGVQDHYPLDVPIGLPLAVPSRPILPLVENWKWISSEHPSPTSAPSVSAAPAASRRQILEQLKGAERLFAASPDGWHALGLIEMRRAANVPGPLPAPRPPHVAEFRLGALWRMLEGPNLVPFCDQAGKLSLDDAEKEQQFWADAYKLLCAQQAHDDLAAANVKLSDLPREFPSHAADRARLDMLAELGVPKEQAAIDILSARSYEPLRKLRGLDAWDATAPQRAQLHDGYLAGSHDLVERLFALRMLGRSTDAEDLIAQAGNLRYLVDRNDLEVLLARLGPADAWEKFLRPLMEDEVGFIENPPRFDESGPRPQQDVVVEAAGKSEQGGAVTYSASVKLSAGPWRMTCDKLAALPHPLGHAVLFKGSGTVEVRGVIGLFRAAAPEMTFDTETGALKLAGGVHLEEWGGNRDVKSCTISRTGDLQSEP